MFAGIKDGPSERSGQKVQRQNGPRSRRNLGNQFGVDDDDSEFEALWSRLLEPRQNTGTTSAGSEPKPPSQGSTTIRPNVKKRIPRVGTIVQRSSAANSRKLYVLMETPPSPSRRVLTTGRPRRPMSASQQTIADLFGDALSDLSDDDRASGSPSTSSQDVSAKQRAPNKASRRHQNQY